MFTQAFFAEYFKDMLLVALAIVGFIAFRLTRPRIVKTNDDIRQ